MIPGTVVTRGDRLFVVLQAEAGRAAVAPVVLGSAAKRRAGDVPVSLGVHGPGIAVCGAVALESGAWGLTGISMATAELAACRAAADRAARERSLNRFAPLSLFAQAQPHFRSGGRRVGGACAGA
jgi:hypothetical protein